MTRLWTKALTLQAKAMYDRGIKTKTKSRVYAEISIELGFPILSVEHRMKRLNKGATHSYQWSEEELKILRTAEKRDGRVKRESIKALLPLLPKRTYSSIRHKLYAMGILVEWNNKSGALVDKEKARSRDIEMKTLDQVMLGTDSIYDRAARKIGGTYKNGIISKNGKPLTGSQTMKLLAEVRQGYS